MFFRFVTPRMRPRQFRTSASNDHAYSVEDIDEVIEAYPDLTVNQAETTLLKQGVSGEFSKSILDGSPIRTLRVRITKRIDQVRNDVLSVEPTGSSNR
jgi:hypothetical protein